MKLYTIKDVALERGITVTSARQLAKRHNQGTNYGKQILFTTHEFRYLSKLPSWDQVKFGR